MFGRAWYTSYLLWVVCTLCGSLFVIIIPNRWNYIKLGCGFCNCLFLITKWMQCWRRLDCGRRHDVNFTDIKRNKNSDLEIMIKFLMYYSHLKNEKKNGHMIRGKNPLFHLYFLYIRSYQCMNMCINVPWQFEKILPESYPR